MCKYALRLLAFVSFVGWCLSAKRAHHYEPESPERSDDDDWEHA